MALVAALDLSGEWAADGTPTCAHWVARALRVEVSTAREWLRVGHALRRLSVVHAALRDGRLSYSKVRTLTRVATPAREVELCELATQVPAGRLGPALASWLIEREAPAETEARHRAARWLSWRVEPDGMVAGSFRLPPAEAAVLTGAVDAAVNRPRPRPAVDDASADAWRRPDRWSSVAQQRADALVGLVRDGGADVVTEVVLHVRADGCTLDDGTPVAASVVERLAPDAFLRALIHDAAGRPINASGRHRHPTARQRRVVQARDRACVECGATEWLQYDHEPAFERSGRTVVDELRLRCRDCHRARHKGGVSPGSVSTPVPVVEGPGR